MQIAGSTASGSGGVHFKQPGSATPSVPSGLTIADDDQNNPANQTKPT